MSQGNLVVPRRIKDGLRTDFVGQEIYHFTEVTSTNDVAKELATKGAKEGAVVISEIQSRGRGRMGRLWISPEGGIWFSVILRPKISSKDAPKTTFAIALAVTKTITRMFGLNVKIKWPNDVLVDNKKVCGILTELSNRGDAVDFVVAGVGINANNSVKNFPEALRGSVTSLKEQLRKEIPRESLLQALLEELEHYYETLTQHGFDPILQEWKSLTETINTHVEVTGFDQKVVGKAIDVDQDGALLVQLKDGSITKVISGDIHVRTRRR